ncbi:MAG: flagellar hook-length control protein FliK [Steroidobacteraceae bacterium]
MTPQPAAAAVDSAGGGKELPVAMLQSLAVGGVAPSFSLALGQLQIPALPVDGQGEALPKHSSEEQGKEPQSELMTAAPDPALAALAAVLQWLRPATRIEHPATPGQASATVTPADSTAASAIGVGSGGAAAALAMPALIAGYLKSTEQGTGANEGSRTSAAAPIVSATDQARPEGVAATGALGLGNLPAAAEIHALAELFGLAAPDPRPALAVATGSDVAPDGAAATADGKAAPAAPVNANVAPGMAGGFDSNSALRAGGSAAVPQSERTISVPVHDRHWSQAMAAQILVLTDQRIESATLRLTPEHLGPVDVRIDIADSKVNVSFGAAHSDTRAALELALPRLREVLAGAGLTLGEASVQQQMRRGSQNRSDGARAVAGVADQSTAAMISVRRMLGVIDEYV